MRRIRVTAQMQKRLTDLRDRKTDHRRGGVMRVPPILSPDEWERLAAPLQDKLIQDSHEDRSLPVKPVVNGPDPADRTSAYRSTTR